MSFFARLLTQCIKSGIKGAHLVMTKRSILIRIQALSLLLGTVAPALPRVRNCDLPLWPEILEISDSRWGAYFPYTGRVLEDFNAMFAGPNSWSRMRLLALIEENLLHEYAIDRSFEALHTQIKMGRGPILKRAGITYHADDKGITFERGNEKLRVQLTRRFFTLEVIRLNFTYTPANSSTIFESEFRFPESYRNPNPSMPVAGREMRTRRLTWGLPGRFSGAWRISQFEFLSEALRESGVYESKKIPELRESSERARKSYMAASFDFMRQYIMPGIVLRASAWKEALKAESEVILLDHNAYQVRLELRPIGRVPLPRLVVVDKEQKGEFVLDLDSPPGQFNFEHYDQSLGIAAPSVNANFRASLSGAGLVHTSGNRGTEYFRVLEPLARLFSSPDPTQSIK